MNSRTRSPHFVVIPNDFGFPVGMAATQRVRLLCRAVREAGGSISVMCIQPTERPGAGGNTEAAGIHDGVPFEYTSGTPVQPEAVWRRRLLQLQGLAVAVVRLCRLRAAGRLDGIYLWGVMMRMAPVRLVFVALASMLRVPLVVELNERPWSLKPSASRLERRLSPLLGVDGVVVISDWLSRWVRIESRLQSRGVHSAQIPIVVDVAETVVRPYPSGRPQVLFAASPSYAESLRFILNAMDGVWRRYPDCRLVVTCVGAGDLPGDGGRTVALKQRLADGQLVLSGYLPRAGLLQAYADSNALLAPLFDDSSSMARFPTKIGEYLATARPVVTNAVGEIPRFFRHQGDAMVVPPGDAEAYADAICRLLADPVRAAAIGLAGRRLAERRFHYAQYGAPLLALFSAARQPVGVPL